MSNSLFCCATPRNATGGVLEWVNSGGGFRVSSLHLAYAANNSGARDSDGVSQPGVIGSAETPGYHGLSPITCPPSILRIFDRYRRRVLKYSAK